MRYPKVSIILLNWNGFNDTVECLTSLKDIDYPAYEIIVVDNFSTKNNPDCLKELFPHIILIKNSRNLGFAGGNNVGIKYAIRAGSDYVWLLNNDTVVDKNALTNLIGKAEALPALGLISPTVYFYASPSQLQYCGSYFEWDKFLTRDIKDFNEVHKVADKTKWLWGTALLIKRNVVEQIGYLDEDLFAYFEDTEYSLRALRAGYTCEMEYNAKIFHKGHYVDKDGTKGLPPHHFFYMTRNRYMLWMRNLHGVRRLLFFKRYAADVIRNIGSYKELDYPEAIVSSLQGFYCALFNIGGIWKNDKKIPDFIKKIILLKPFLLADLIDMNFIAIAREIVRRVGLV